MPFQAIETQRLYQQVAQQVADLIQSGELPPGERLPAERELAKRLGVSRPTIREAMIALEIAGLVEVRTGTGVFVRDTTPTAIDAGQVPFDVGPSPFDVLGARLLIEPEIAALAALAADDARLASVANCIKRLREAPDHDQSLAADQEFHASLARATGNGVLVSIVEELWASMSSPVYEVLASKTGLPDTDSMTIADHEDILGCVAARQPDEAREAMRRHLKHVEEILSTYEEIEQGSADPDPATPAHTAVA